ncbi:hypothetical protein PTTG_09755 [Puccinia triticina 1-1 BBBD Race 1]|uniref:Non-structural maintenance of chromosomes element 4 n=2 Tax=Puccinia triticina TaxID=208348 RepID=A0A180GLB9_PUCT1|nr:uncharacterized protein PtA15_12A559 [Puccinia triticina]OAV93586.1 hypothetical protein PTTG_09755 [Puccinia triticina 1-1 BBBD Race 1]WAQ90569.1 hypothetical protein PtA15_12A559 [Puccinia triticina]WAR61881.1 hypothetical protein PtB15_12B573 [Puccinia triticina]
MSRIDQMRHREQQEREHSEPISVAEDQTDHDAIIKQTQAEIIAGTNDVYNPNQNKEQVRGARKVLRSYEETASSMKDNATVITAEEFNKQVLGLDNNFKSHVRAPAEATIDSRALRFLSETALKKSKLFKIDVNAIDPDEFVLRFRKVMTAKAPMIDHAGNSSEEDEGVADGIDWFKVGKRLMRFSRRAPVMDFMYGPLEIQQKTRKFSQRPKLEKHESDRKEPELIDNNDIERSQAEMSALIKKISDLLTTEGAPDGMNLFQFFINPDSFSQSVENLFCLSFLIRDGKAAIETYDDDEVEREFPIVYSTEPAGADMIQEGFTKTQIILELTMQDWKDAIDLYGIKRSVIPNRVDEQPTTSKRKSGKWH